MTRDPKKPAAEALAKAGAEIVTGDLDDPASIARAAEGMYGLFSVQPFFGADVAHEISEGKAVADAAKKAGIRHFVYTGVASADKNTGVPHFDSKWQIETYIRSLGLPASFLRPVFFMDNFINLPNFRDAVLSGTLAFPLDPAKPLQMIATDDIGAIAACVFEVRETFLGKAIELAGDALTGPQICEVLSKAIGRKVAYQSFPPEALRETAEEFYLMFDWFNRVGYTADIGACRKLHPGLKRFDEWAHAVRWPV